MPISPAALSLLEDIFMRLETGGAAEPRQAIEARLEQPWLLDELLASGLASDLFSPRILPTVAGISLLESQTARSVQANCGRVREEAARMYRESPAQQRTVDEIAEAVGFPAEETSRALSYLLVSEPGLFRQAASNPFGLVISVVFEGGVLGDRERMAPPSGSGDAGLGPVELSANDFRCLPSLQWCPSGVCMLAGSNGSGKSTVLDAFAFLATAFQKGLSEAVTEARGAEGLQRLGAEASRPISFSIRRADVRWAIDIPVLGGGIADLPGETVTVGDKTAVRRLPHSSQWYLYGAKRSGNSQGRTCFRMASERDPEAFSPLVRVLEDFRRYGAYNLERLREGGRGGERETQLSQFGENALIVLRNWRAAPNRFDNRFVWVVDKMRSVFPGLIDDIDFDPPAGIIVPARFILPDRAGVLPIHRASDGMLVGLLHLVAVAGAAKGSVIAIDEVENHLHPHAIRQLIRAMREIATDRDLTVILTTHSPVAMDEFRDEPDKFFVMEPGRDVVPVALDELHDPAWLKQFALGDLYAELRFGAPRAPGT